MIDENGNPVHSFNNGMAVVSNGNHIEITGTNGEHIRFNIQLLPFADRDPMGVVLVPPPVTYTYGDGATFAAGAPDPLTLAPTAPTAMSIDIKNYGPIMLQIGPNFNNAMAVHIPTLSAETLGLVEFKGGKMYNLMKYTSVEGAWRAIDASDAAIAFTSVIRSRLGAYQNRLESTIRSLDVAAENTENSRSRIRDTDMAKESTKYAQYNVMYQAGLAILAQANMRPQQILSLMQ
jgi:flagellin